MRNKIDLVLNFLRQRLFVIFTAVILICGLVAGFLFYQTLPKIIAKASSIVFGDGVVSIDKKYVKNDQEVDSISTPRTSQVTVRLKYNNTSTQSSISNYILDSIPSGFNFVSGSLKNCYVDANCVTLNNNLFSGQNLRVAPGAGYFGYQNNNSLTSSNLELGKKKYLTIDQCNYTDSLNADNYSTRNLRASNSLPATTCNTSSSLSYNQLAYFDLTGSRYVRQGRCNYFQPSSNDNYSYRDIWEVGNNTLTNSTCASVDPSIVQYLTDSSSVNYDTLQSRYIHQNQCNYSKTRTNSTIDTYTHYDIISFDNLDTATNTCAQNADITNATVSTVDLSDTSRGYGYIEYKMLTPNSSGTFGTNVSLNGSFSNSNIVDTATNTVFVEQLNCQYVYPANATRTVNLGDAELRTDQDFSCNVNPRICPVVFIDANTNGVYDTQESKIDNVTVDLKSEDNSRLIDTLQTSSTNSVCFQSLSNATNYNVILPSPPAGDSTTNGLSQTIPVRFDSGYIPVAFGFFTGGLYLSANQSINLSPVTISSTNQQSCGTLSNIQVIDSRLSNPGWTLTATVQNFRDDNLNLTLPVANRFLFSPQTINILDAQPNQIPTPGKTTTVTSTTDSVSIMSAGSGFGKGTFRQNVDICQTITPLDYAGNFKTIITFTVV